MYSNCIANKRSEVMVLQCNMLGPGHHLGGMAKSMHPLLSSKTVQCIFGEESSVGITFFNSPNNPSSGITSLSDWDRATYSLSVVDSVISVCSFEHHMIGQLAYMMT